MVDDKPINSYTHVYEHLHLYGVSGKKILIRWQLMQVRYLSFSYNKKNSKIKRQINIEAEGTDRKILRKPPISVLESHGMSLSNSRCSQTGRLKKRIPIHHMSKQAAIEKNKGLNQYLVLLI